MNGQLIGDSLSITASKSTLSSLSKSDSFIILLNPGSGGSQLSRAGSGGCQLSVEAGSVLSDSLSVSHYPFPIRFPKEILNFILRRCIPLWITFKISGFNCVGMTVRQSFYTALKNETFVIEGTQGQFIN